MPGFAPYSGPRYFFSTGRSTIDLDAADGFVTIQDAGNTHTFPTAAALATEIVSADANDDGSPVDTGARTVRVTGLDADYVYVSQDVIMNGSTSVDLATALRRVFSVQVLTAGSTNNSEGNIDVRLADDTVVVRLLAGLGATTVGSYCGPEGTQTRLLAFGASIDAADAIVPDVSVRLMIQRDNLIAEVIATIGIQSLGNGPNRHDFKDFRIDARTDVWLEADTDLDNTLVTGWLELEHFLA